MAQPEDMHVAIVSYSPKWIAIRGFVVGVATGALGTAFWFHSSGGITATLFCGVVLYILTYAIEAAAQTSGKSS